MTVKEAISVLQDAKSISLAWCHSIIPFDKDNDLTMDAYGKYKVNAIRSFEEDTYEIYIATRPIKEETV